MEVNKETKLRAREESERLECLGFEEDRAGEGEGERFSSLQDSERSGWAFFFRAKKESMVAGCCLKVKVLNQIVIPDFPQIFEGNCGS